MSTFAEMVATLQERGFYQFLLPFVLIFVVTYAGFNKLKLFPEDQQSMSALLALVIAFFATGYLATVQVELFFASFLSRIGILVVFMVMGMMIYQFATGGGD